MGKNGDPQTGWIGGEVSGCSFQVDNNNCPQSGVNLYGFSA